MDNIPTIKYYSALTKIRKFCNMWQCWALRTLRDVLCDSIYMRSNSWNQIVEQLFLEAGKVKLGSHLSIGVKIYLSKCIDLLYNIGPFGNNNVLYK